MSNLKSNFFVNGLIICAAAGTFLVMAAVIIAAVLFVVGETVEHFTP